MNPEIFRTYDIRGIADTELTNDVIGNIAKAYGTLLPKGAKQISIGMDVRLSSERIKNAFIQGLLTTGKNVVDFGMIPTPVLYFAVHKYELDGGVEITGSHNPKEYNGIKILIGKNTIFGDDIQKIREIAEAGKFREGKAKRKTETAVGDYIDDILKRVSFGKRKIKIVFDCGNGTTGPILKRLFSNLSFDFEILYAEPNGNFPNHLPDPTIPEYLSTLIEKVKTTDADVGIALDGDGDRIGAIDEKGSIIWGDKLLAIYSKKVLERMPGSKIICEVKCSKGLIEYIEKKGGIPIMWKTGHSLIKAKMREENASLAGEMSGHMFFADNYYGFDDAIFASLRLIELLSHTEKPLSELADEVPSYFVTPEIRIDCPEKEKFRVVQEVKREFQKNYKILDIDGVRVTFHDGWGLLRASNTQPVLVLRFEANTQQALEQIKSKFIDLLRKYPFVKV